MGLNREGWGGGALIQFSGMHQWEEGFLRMDNNKEMLTIPHRELEHKVEKVQHMKFHVAKDQKQYEFPA